MEEDIIKVNILKQLENPRDFQNVLKDIDQTILNDIDPTMLSIAVFCINFFSQHGYDLMFVATFYMGFIFNNQRKYMKHHKLGEN